MSDLDPVQMLDRRQDRLEHRVETLENESDKVPALEREVGLLREGFNRNTQAMYQVGIGIFVTGVLGVVTALVLKGVIG